MAKTVEIAKNIHWIGVNDRRTYLFENLWPLEKGMAYNSYLINDKKKAIIDTVDANFDKEYISNIKQILNNNSPEYLIINHMEPDHSGSITMLRKEFPGITIVCNKLMAKMLDVYYDITDNIQLIKDKEQINLGNINLTFYMTPWLHWPETMMTYDGNSKVLFSGDAFGSFGALDGGIFDDEVNYEELENEARRYYSNIVGKFTCHTQSALEKLKNTEISIIASTHGPVWRSDPDRMIDWYNKWSTFVTEPGVVIAYSSMYGNTARMADLAARFIAEKGMKNIKVYDTSKTHMSYIVSDIWKYKGVILASPTYNLHLHPTMQALITELKDLGIQDHFLGVIGSYAWNSKASKYLKQFGEDIKWELVADPIIVHGALKEKHMETFEKLAQKMVEKIK